MEPMSLLERKPTKGSAPRTTELNIESAAPPADAIQRELHRLLTGAGIEVGGSQPWDIRIHNPATYQRIMLKRSLGLGESYMDGWWDCDDLEGFFYRLFKARIDQMAQTSAMLLWQLMSASLRNRQSLGRSRQVAEQHYDLDNHLFELMLDPTLAYSCGYWRDAADLHEAQVAKLDLICRKMQLEPGMRVLDIGCGWGSFVHHAASRYGVAVDGVTVSKEQQHYAQQRCAGLPVSIWLKDYRKIEGRYDRIVSVGMFEHVGRRNYPLFMDVVLRQLNDDGMALLHTIGNNVTTKSFDPWINKYIFPNGELPSLQQITAAAEGRFVIEDVHNFGPDYAKTLRAWDANFCRHWDQLASRYDQRFYRMWRYYLNVCAAAFRVRAIQLWQVVLTKPGFREQTYQAPR